MVAQKPRSLRKNPKAIAKRRERLDAVIWDETQSQLIMMQAGAMMMSGGMPGANQECHPPKAHQSSTGSAPMNGGLRRACRRARWVPGRHLGTLLPTR